MKLAKCSLQLKAFDTGVLNKTYEDIKDSVKGISGIHLSGLIPLPVRTKKITVNRSPHIDKKSREQFEVRTFYRIVQITSISSDNNMSHCIERLKKMVFFGIDIKVVFTYSDTVLL